MIRDMSKTAFDKECIKHGIERDRLGWYYVLENTLCFAGNGGPTRRGQLAYLIQQQERIMEEDMLGYGK